MVEGSLSTENSTFEKLDINTSINITASKIYPFALTKKTK